MKNFSIKLFLKDGYHLSIFFTAITIPLARTGNSFSLILLGFFWLLNLLSNRGFSFCFKCYFFLFISIFVSQLITFFYSDNKVAAVFSYEKYIPLLIIPIFLSNDDYFIRKRATSIIKAFVLSCIAAFIMCLCLAAYTNFMRNEFSKILPELYFINTTFYVGISHVYFSMYLSFGIIFLILNVFFSKTLKFSVIIIAFLLTFFLFFIGGKMSLIALVFCLLSSSIIYFVKTKRTTQGVVLVISLVIMIALCIYTVPFIRDRFSSLIDERNYFVGDNQWNSIGTRVSIFYCSYELIKDNYFLGYGTGDVQTALDQCFESNRFSTLKGMNAHNQYIQFILSGGIISSLCFIVSLIVPFRRAFLLNDFLYINFIILFALCSLTESTLAVNKGIVFYSFFNSYLGFSMNIKGNRLP